MSPARHAASLLLVRGIDDDAPEVLMGLRGAGHKFMPNRLVFPGGAVDPSDHGAAIAAMPAAHVILRLAAGAEGSDSLPHALLHAAARELLEETGLSLGEPPDVSGLDYLCRAVTPEVQPRRFDARFLVADAALASGTLAGSGELEDLRWYPVAEALAIDLAYPTRKVLEQFLDWRRLDAEARAARRMTPTMRELEWVME